MADVLRRGPVGDDAQIAYELFDLFDLVRRHAVPLTRPEPADPVDAIELGNLLEDVGNRFIDMMEALNARHLDAYRAAVPDGGGDLSDEDDA